MRKSLIILAAMTFGTVADARQVVYQVYECPRCHRTSEFNEDAAHIHHCEGGNGKDKHADQVMTHKGRTTKDVK